MKMLGLFLAFLAFAAGDWKRVPDAKAGPKPGEKAPDFTLPRLEGKEKVKLSDFQDKAPVVLVFGSYT